MIGGNGTVAAERMSIRALVREWGEARDEWTADARSDYDAMRDSPYRRVRRLGPLGTGADYHYRHERAYWKMVEGARDMDRNDSVIGQAVDRACVNTLRDGFVLDVNTGNSEADDEIKLRWEAWASDPDQCDLEGERDFNTMAWLSLRHTFVDGDFVGIGMKAGNLQLVESHRIRTVSSTRKNVVLGVLVGDDRRRRQYWVTKQNINPMRQIQTATAIQPFDVRDSLGNRMLFHAMDPRRASQTRGVTVLAPIFDTLGMLGDIQFARLVQQQVVSSFAVFHQFAADEFTRTGGKKTGATTTEQMSDGSERTHMGTGPGQRIQGLPGETMMGFSPNVPNPEYFPFVRLILTMIGINLGLPLVMMLLDSSETNFSGWRGAVNQAQLGFRRNQKWLSARWHSPIFKFKVLQWIADDPIFRRMSTRVGPAIFKHKWKMPASEYVDPLKDAQADALRIRSGLTSMRRLQSERGRDEEDVRAEMIEDNGARIAAAIKKADELNALSKDARVSWRDLMMLPTQEGGRIRLDEQSQTTEARDESARSA